MNLSEYAQYDGMGLAELVRNKEVTARDLVKLALEGVYKINPSINAVIETYNERVEKADDLIRTDAPFSGIPFFLKDLGATENGKRQEMGSRLAQGYVADKDSFLTKRFKDAGVIIIGRTTTPEFGMTFTTESILTGATCNPWDLGRTTGGSSGGTAASVAAGILPVAHANDGGGSIRVPAACCGVLGLKPSRGRVTLGPDSDESIFGFVQEFIISRTVRDAAAMLDAVSMPVTGDPFVIVQPRQPYLKGVSAPISQLHIAFTTKSWTGDEVDTEIADEVRSIARVCEDMGHYVEEALPYFDYEPFVNASMVLWDSFLGTFCDSLAGKMGRKVDTDYVEPVTFEEYKRSTQISITDLFNALTSLNLVRRQVGQFFEKYDLLLTPTTAQLPVHLGTTHLNQRISIEEYEGLAFSWVPFTSLFNITGQPAISLPLAQSKTNLPIGIQFAARFGEEDLLLRVAKTFEEAMPWIKRIPSVHVSQF